jgi:hypothetical protein
MRRLAAPTGQARYCACCSREPRVWRERAEGLGGDELAHIEKHAGVEVVSCGLERAARSIDIEAAVHLREPLAAGLQLAKVRAVCSAGVSDSLEGGDDEPPLLDSRHLEPERLPAFGDDWRTGPRLSELLTASD